MNEIFHFQVILTHVSKEIGQIQFGVEMDIRRMGYTSSVESGMKSSLLCFFFVFFVISDNNLPISREKKQHNINHKNAE